jgi:hypothetical protein
MAREQVLVRRTVDADVAAEAVVSVHSYMARAAQRVKQAGENGTYT